ncbi:MarR family winged helix-turn-helix transcriptional regulator [Actinopolymorpha alba]|uniref:MarR family winged helix-turn-helix transcriptional regulator n=1 Tax=Actinopolymorpha alba TaxID=533267 RepID=UPI0003734C56|nr:MarR family winged helix-turn-helix transcriptional regulator [Actinopolymorpha alba]
MTRLERPIGYWLKHLHRLIEAAFDDALAHEGLSRRHWQALNVLHRSAADVSVLAHALEPFWTEGALTLEEVIDDLQRRGWIAQDAVRSYRLTPDGTATHTNVAGRIEVVRTRMLDGLTPQDYEETLRVLRRMADNLETPRDSQVASPV